MSVKVSVIIPVYNRAQYLAECLDSIVQQTLSPIEIIAVNDGSTDHSLSILNKYADKYSNIVILTQVNQGSGPARNNGIRHAKGKYLIFMDPDDYYPTDDCLESLYNAAEENNISICGGILIKDRYGEKTIAGGEKLIKYHCNRIVTVNEYPSIYWHTRFLFRADIIKDNNIFFPSYRRNQDPPFLLRVMICSGEGYMLDKVVYVYRVGHKGVKYSLENSIGILCGVRDVVKLAKENNLLQIYENALKNVDKEYENQVAFYKYSYCGYKEVDSTIEEINEMIREWIGDNASLIKTKETVLQMRESCQKEYNILLQILCDNRKKIFYGAGTRTHELLEQHKDDMRNVIGIAVTNKQDHTENFLYGLPIKNIEDYLLHREDALIIISTVFSYQDEIEQHLKRLGFKSILKLDMAKLELAEALRSDT